MFWNLCAFFVCNLALSCDECNKEFAMSGCNYAYMVMMNQIPIEQMPLPAGCESCDVQAMMDTCERKQTESFFNFIFWNFKEC